MGQREFDERFASLFGSRWPGLRAALLDAGDAVDYAEGLAAPYHLDSASVVAARALRLPEAGSVLDACAAPGGKSLVMASLMGAGVRLLSNELSSERRRRLSGVLDAHLQRARAAAGDRIRFRRGCRRRQTQRARQICGGAAGRSLFKRAPRAP